MKNLIKNNYNYALIILLSFGLILFSILTTIYDLHNTNKIIITDKKYIYDTYKIEINEHYLKQPSDKYIELLKQYNKDNYNLDIYLLENPTMIVIHTSECKTLDILVNTFESDILLGRKDITNYGQVNVGSHFLIDTNGMVFNNMPLDYIARHVIGFNYTAIGIENVGLKKDGFTLEQIEANKSLIKFLKSIYPSIKYIIGHYEYNDETKEHYKTMIKNYDKSHNLPDRFDPGQKIMSKIIN